MYCVGQTTIINDCYCGRFDCWRQPMSRPRETVSVQVIFDMYSDGVRLRSERRLWRRLRWRSRRLHRRFVGCWLFRPPGTSVSGGGGFCFARDVFFYFATRSPSSLDRWLPWNFATVHMIENWLNFIVRVLKFWERSRKKIWEPKTCKNFRQLCTTSDLDRKYLRNETTYPKSERRTKLRTRQIPPAFDEKV